MMKISLLLALVGVSLTYAQRGDYMSDDYARQYLNNRYENRRQNDYPSYEQRRYPSQYDSPRRYDDMRNKMRSSLNFDSYKVPSNYQQDYRYPAFQEYKSQTRNNNFDSAREYPLADYKKVPESKEEIPAYKDDRATYTEDTVKEIPARATYTEDTVQEVPAPSYKDESAEPAKAEPVKAEPVKAEPVKAEPVKAEPAKAEPVKAEPVKAEPVKAEPVKAEPVKAEPVKADVKIVNANSDSKYDNLFKDTVEDAKPEVLDVIEDVKLAVEIPASKDEVHIPERKDEVLGKLDELDNMKDNDDKNIIHGGLDDQELKRIEQNRIQADATRFQDTRRQQYNARNYEDDTRQRQYKSDYEMENRRRFYEQQRRDEMERRYRQRQFLERDQRMDRQYGQYGRQI